MLPPQQRSRTPLREMPPEGSFQATLGRSSTVLTQQLRYRSSLACERMARANERPDVAHCKPEQPVDTVAKAARAPPIRLHPFKFADMQGSLSQRQGVGGDTGSNARSINTFRGTVAVGTKAQSQEGANMSKHFITGAARSVTNSVERLIELRKNHPEWDDRPSEKALARERLLKPRSTAFTASPGALSRP